MAFTAKDWKDATTHEGGGDVTTPISSAAIEDLEGRVASFADSLAGTAAGIHNLKDYGAAGDGSTDDTSAITNAVNAGTADGGIVYVPPGTFTFDGTITVPEGVSIQGAGASWAGNPGSVLKGTASGSQLFFENTKSFNSGFSIDGGGVANNPMRVDMSFGVTFAGISVENAAEDNIVIYDAQQCTMYSCDSNQAGRDGLVIDGSAKSCLISRMDSTSAARHAVYLGTADGTFSNGNGYNRFDHSLFENQAGTTTDPLGKIERCGADGMTIFDSCLFVAGGDATTAGTIFEVNEANAWEVANLNFNNCLFQDNNASADIGLGVDIANFTGGITVTGDTRFVSVGAGIKASTAETVNLFGQLAASGPAQRRVVSTASETVRLLGHISFPSLDAHNDGTGVYGIAGSLVAPMSLFVNAASEKLAFRDPGGTIHDLY